MQKTGFEAAGKANNELCGTETHCDFAKSSLICLEKCLAEFSEENKSSFEKVIYALEEYYRRPSSSERLQHHSVSASNTAQDSLEFISFRILSIISKLNSSPYFIFYAQRIYGFLFSLLYQGSSFPRTLKIDVLNALIRMYDPEMLHSDVLDAYNYLDTFYFKRITEGRVCFRNYCLLVIYDRILSSVKHVEDPDGNGPEGIRVWDALEKLSKVEPFVDFLIRTNSHLAIIYAHFWIVKYEHGSPIDISVIKKIFPNYAIIRNAVLIRLEEPGHISEAFQRCLTKKNTALVFKKLFFYFLLNKNNDNIHKNIHHILSGCKLIQVFSKTELKYIYKKLKGKSACVNIFRQLDQRFLIKELKNGKEDIRILSNIDPAKLAKRDLLIYYEVYFRIIGNGFSLKASYADKRISALVSKGVRVVDLDVFSMAFNSVYDKGFIKNIRIRDGSKIIEGSGSSISISADISLMLLYYTAEHHNSFVDPVWVASWIWTLSEKQIDSNAALIINNILWVLYNIYDQINSALRIRLLSVLIKMAKVKSFTFRAGMLLSKYNMSIALSDENITDLEVIAGINHPSFTRCLKESPSTVPYLALVYQMYYLAASSEKEQLEVVVKLLEKSINKDVYAAILILRFIELTDLTSGIGTTIFFDFASRSESFVASWVDGSTGPMAVNILLRLLKCRAVLPATAVPLVMSRYDSGYLQRHYLETMINTTHEAIQLLAKRIRSELPEKLEDLDSLERIINEHFFRMSHISDGTIRAILARFEYDDVLVIFLLLRQFIYLSRASREFACKYVEEHAGNEQIENLASNALESYRGTRRGVLSVGCIFQES